DNIPAGEESKYLNRSPYNFSHLDLPVKPQDDYAHSRKNLKEWQEKGILKSTAIACYFLYEQRFESNEGPSGTRKHSRRTLMAAVELHDFSDGVILPHENTHGKYKLDRLQLMKATEANLS